MKCKHCGEPIVQARYGSTLRWMHTSTENPTWIDLWYLGCRSGYVAEPK